ncbi:MAG: oxidoreductase, partial [Bacteroidota bacterium]
MQYSRTALVFGATGLVGKELLYLLLEHKSYLLVKAVVRKPLAIKHPQLQQIVVDFTRLNEYTHELNADDVKRFPEEKYGPATKKNKERVLKICAEYSNHGAVVEDLDAA